MRAKPLTVVLWILAILIVGLATVGTIASMPRTETERQRQCYDYMVQKVSVDQHYASLSPDMKKAYRIRYYGECKARLDKMDEE